jgi:uncharacterized protein (TIGR02646 family)
MKTIQQNTEPECLFKQPKNQSWGDFARTPCHAETRSSLAEEQYGLCCYCESQVSDGDGHIEHMEPKGRNPKRTYDYTNLVLSCNGSDKKHCGHFKDGSKSDFAWDSKKFCTPHDPETCTLFSYDNLGNVNPTDSQPEKARYMIGYLNLNCPSLAQRRHSHAISLIETLGEQPDPRITSWLRERYLRPDTKGCLQPYYSLSKAILNP